MDTGVDTSADALVVRVVGLPNSTCELEVIGWLSPVVQEISPAAIVNPLSRYEHRERSDVFSPYVLWTASSNSF